MKNKIKLLGIMTIMMFILCSCSCNFNDEYGTFYTLRDAYSKGLLNDEDLIEIASYYQDEELTNKNDSLAINLLDEKTQKQIKKSYLLNIINDITVSDEYVNIYAYYGTYNSAIAVGITDTYNVYDKLIIPEYRVGDVILYNYAESDIRIWVK